MFTTPETNQTPTSQTADLVNRREKVSVQIRKENREDIISKRRNLQPTNAPTQPISVYENADADLKAQIQEFKKINFTLNDLTNLGECIRSGDPVRIYYGTIGVRKLMSESEDPPIQKIVDANLVPKLIEFAKQTQYLQLRIQATWALTNVASGSEHQCQSIVDKGGIPLFVGLLEETNQEIVEHSVWTVGNIAGDCATHRDNITKLKGVQKLSNLVFSPRSSRSLIKQSGWALANLCRGVPKPTYELTKEAVAPLTHIIKNRIIEDPEIVSDILWALAFLSQGSKTRISRVVQTGVTEVLVGYLASESKHILVPVLRVLGNIAYGNELHTEQVLKFGTLGYFPSLLNNSNSLVRREACWVLSNITAGVRSQSMSVMARDELIHRLQQLMQVDISEVQREIAWTFSNAIHNCEPHEIMALVQRINLVPSAVKLYSNVDDKTVIVGLELTQALLKLGEKVKVPGAQNIVINMLHACGGIDAIQKLQEHKNIKVYNKVASIVEAYFVLVNPLA